MICSIGVVNDAKEETGHMYVDLGAASMDACREEAMLRQKVDSRSLPRAAAFAGKTPKAP